MGTGLFWGIILILIGLAIVIKVIFKIDLPIFKVILAFIFIYVGIRILMGGFGWSHWGQHQRHSETDAVFSERYVNNFSEGDNQYNVVFGKTTLDLRDTTLLQEKSRIEVNVVFGGCEVLLNKGMQYKIKVDAAFGGAQLPEDKGVGGFGSSVYTSDGFDESKPYVYIKSSVVFGGMEIKYR